MTVEAMLLFADAHRIFGDDIGRSHGTVSRGNWRHTGSFSGTSTLAAQQRNGYTYVVLFNKRPTEGSYWKELRPQIERLLN